MALISVIIPTYNHADYVGRAIQSALDQTFTDVEIIVVDDGSTDHTQEILANFNDPRLCTIWQPNGGLLSARNKGIRESSAPLVTFLDADDFFLPEKLAVLYSHLQDHPQTGFVAGLVMYVDQQGVVREIEDEAPASMEVVNLLLGNPIHVSAILLRREWLHRVGGFKDDRLFDACGDWDLWLRLAAAGCKMDWVEKVVSGYRITLDQMSQNPHGMRSSAVAVLNDFFSSRTLSQELRVMQNQAMAVALVNAAARAFYADDFEAGNDDLIEAVKLDPNLTANRYQRLSEILVGWAQAPYHVDTESYLDGIIMHLSPVLRGLRPELRKAMAAMALYPLFDPSASAIGMGRRTLLRAVRNDPSRLLNRGVLRMFYDAWTSKKTVI